MRLSSLLRFVTSPVVSAKKKKSDLSLVRCKSNITEFIIHRIRPRLGDKLEFVVSLTVNNTRAN